MKTKRFYEKRAQEVEQEIKSVEHDLTTAEHKLDENPNKENWEAVDALEKKLENLMSEAEGIDWTISHYEEACYYEEQEEMMNYNMMQLA